MRVTIIAIGSRGDVQPCVALGLGLRAAGHDVCLATHANFGPLVTSRGLGFRAVAGNPQGVLNSPDGSTFLEDNDRNAARTTRHLLRLALPHLHAGMRDCFEASRGADAVIASQLGIFFAYHVAEKLGLPLLRAYYAPVSATRSYPAPIMPPWLRVGGRANLMTHALSRQLIWLVLRSATNSMRKEVVGLPPLPLTDPFRRMDRGWPILYGFSPAVVPRPPDWGPWIHITGYWFLDRPRRWAPPEGLVDFIRAGPPPVSIGFGSMPKRSADQARQLVGDALARSGQRGVLVAGWGGLGSGAATSDDLYVLEEIPHDWLFAQMAAVVHHGGAGTTASGLRAGVPTITIPFLPDQRFWGRRILELGVGSEPIPPTEVTADRLATAIRAAVEDAGMRRRAAALAQRIRAENGVVRAVEVFHSHCTERRSSASSGVAGRDDPYVSSLLEETWMTGGSRS